MSVRGASPRYGFALLWLSGNGLRVTLLAVAPVMPLIHADLHLNEKQVGALGSLPVLLLGIAAIPGSLLISRLGARAALLCGLALVGLGSALRGVAPAYAPLLAATFIMGAGVAVMQPSLPALVARWYPQRVGIATAVYSNGLLFGEMLAAALTIPFVLPLVHGSWRWSFVFWAVPVLATAALVMIGTPPDAPVATQRRAWWPNWRDPMIWRLGTMQTGFSSMYFAANAFIPDYLRSQGHGALVGGALTALNSAQLPASVLLLFIANRVVGHRYPLFASSVIAFAGLVSLLSGSPTAIIIGAALLGFAAALMIVMVLALPPLYSAHGDAHRLASAMFTIGYSLSFFIALAGGALWDATHLAVTAFAPVAFGIVAVTAGAATLPRKRAVT